MFGSLDYIYVPAADVDSEVLRYVETLGAELVWKVRGMGATVACVRVGQPGPAILLSGHSACGAAGGGAYAWSGGASAVVPVAIAIRRSWYVTTALAMLSLLPR